MVFTAPVVDVATGVLIFDAGFRLAEVKTIESF
jgi:hypothetical protein